MVKPVPVVSQYAMILTEGRLPSLHLNIILPRLCSQKPPSMTSGFTVVQFFT